MIDEATGRPPMTKLVLVPREPTGEMVRFGEDGGRKTGAVLTQEAGRRFADAAYRSMIEAALRDREAGKLAREQRMVDAANREREGRAAAEARVAEMEKALTEIAVRCEREAHPAAPECLSQTHVEHLNQIAGFARAALSPGAGG